MSMLKFHRIVLFACYMILFASECCCRQFEKSRVLWCNFEKYWNVIDAIIVLSECKRMKNKWMSGEGVKWKQHIFEWYDFTRKTCVYVLIVQSKKSEDHKIKINVFSFWSVFQSKVCCLSCNFLKEQELALLHLESIIFREYANTECDFKRYFTRTS